MSSPFRSPHRPPRVPASARKGMRSETAAEKENPGTPARGTDRSTARSPGLTSSPSSILHLSTPRDASKTGGNTQSPFREWATASLDCLDNEMISPASVAGSLLSPSYSGIPVKIENSPLNSTSETVLAGGHSMPEHGAPAFELSPNQVFSEDMGKNGQKASVDNTPAFKGSEHCDDANVLSPPNMRRYRLSMCDLFAFELLNDKVHVTGFNSAPQTMPSSRKKRYAGVPVTPATMIAAEYHDRGSADLSERKRVCSCKKSRCLKLYCECFSAGVICEGCKCMDCANDGEHEAERIQAVEAIKMRNQHAFAPKIVDEEQRLSGSSVHARGCRCKKSHCLKKYCECFQAGVQCADKCKCEECKNRSDLDATPRDRDGLRPVASASSRESSSPESGKRGLGAGSPPRSKKPRVLDFNVMATPRVASGQDAAAMAEQDSDSYSDAGSGHGGAEFGGMCHNMVSFGSPSSVFLRMPAA